MKLHNEDAELPIGKICGKVEFVKTLQPYGGTLITGAQPRVNGHHHDAWPTHSRGYIEQGTAITGTGQYVIVYAAQLKDASEWVYVYFNFMSYDDFVQAVEWYRSSLVPPLTGHAEGESFNVLCRPTCFAKIAADEFHNWLDNN